MDFQALSPEVIQDIDPAAVTAIPEDDIAKTFHADSIDLISTPLGSKILAFSDQFFAEAANLTKPEPAVSKPGVFVFTGAWYDGWETRRHNPRPFDWVVIRLAVPSGRVKGVEIDTSTFSGNHAPEIAVEGAFCTDADADTAVVSSDYKSWKTILAKQECSPKARQAWRLTEATAATFTHVRLLMFPDGGINRFRLYGDAVAVFPSDLDAELDLAAMVNGGVATRCSDQHFGSRTNLLLPGRGKDMGDGWETKRSRGAHVDWVTIRLGSPGEVTRLEVDTAHFRGNFPQKVQVFAAAPGSREPEAEDHAAWVEILAPQPCGPDRVHEFGGEVLREVAGRTYAFVKMVIIPDGGVKRIRVFGRRRVVG